LASKPQYRRNEAVQAIDNDTLEVMYMVGYKNFGVAVYFTTRCLASITTLEEFEKEFSFLEKHLKISKVYLETYRDDMDVPEELLRKVKQFFENKGIKVSGGITTTIFRSYRNKPLIDEAGIFGCGGSVIGKNASLVPKPEKGTMTTWSTMCFTSEAERHKMKEITEFTASIFDEFILDDFFFTNCTCESCIRAKGSRSWEQFRLELMTEVAENLVIKPAKKVNPNCRIIIKYPNWYEAFQETGYNTETQPPLFDGVYTGTETRDTDHSMQHLPRYGSYSLVRWLENVKPGCNGGGWIDPHQGIHNLAYYLEQAHLTLFAKGRELTLFCYTWIIDSIFIPPIGFELEKLDRILSEVGEPVGLPVYEPHHAHGEEHLYDYLGTAGIAFEPVPVFPQTDRLVLLTENSAGDEDVLDRMKEHMSSGGDICITSGFLGAMQGKGIEDFTSASVTGGRVYAKDYSIGGFGSVFTGEYYGRDEVLLPVVKYMNNSADCLIALRKSDNNFPVLLRNRYANGTLYVLTIPDDYADIYKYPREVITTIRQYLMSSLGIYPEADGKFGLFVYDNDTVIIESFTYRITRIRLRTAGVKALKDLRTGAETAPLQQKEEESIFEVPLQPVFYRAFRLIR
jgi:hypothetical protein